MRWQLYVSALTWIADERTSDLLKPGFQFIGYKTTKNILVPENPSDLSKIQLIEVRLIEIHLYHTPVNYSTSLVSVFLQKPVIIYMGGEL